MRVQRIQTVRCSALVEQARWLLDGWEECTERISSGGQQGAGEIQLATCASDEPGAVGFAGCPGGACSAPGKVR